ncbi:tRNA (adenosine(37)-N6)-dimethylallyltransferase MiaA [Candidatus Phycorickettsia trachydisci]|nr:tRNA (adenosine(37)-N6)-dimethylallyltransferase MiaA [Candidatus Phycorickettsia trachydisci]
MRKIHIICGPTASGKSAYALDMAQKIRAIIINADALQVYKQLKIITCCPKEEDLKITQHFLYNHIDIFEEYNAHKYVNQVVEVLTALPDHIPTIIVGGTGMYLQFLIQGVHRLPEIDSQIRKSVRDKISDPIKLYKELKEIDPLSASTLNQLDTKRISRALEVYLQTSKSITSFYRDDNLYRPLEGCDITTHLLLLDRKKLYENCNKRFESLIKQGALDEAQKILPLWDNLHTSAKKALGLKELVNYLKDEVSLDDAIKVAQQKTRNFAKRQMTWFRHQLKADHIIS